MTTILVIDDDESVRDACELALEDTPYDVIVADCGEAGLDRALATNPAMIFLDLKMPGIDGVETLRQLRASGIQAVVYIVTAFMPDYLDDLAVAARDGLVFGLGQKPLSGEQIRMIATGMLEQPQGD